MANNRLFIRNRITGKYTGFLKSFGEGWEIRKTAEQIKRDVKELWDEGSYGNCYNAATDLELITENDPRFKEIDGLLVETTTEATVNVPFEMAVTKKFLGMLATEHTLLKSP